jgi:hypothetical protein
VREARRSCPALQDVPRRRPKHLSHGQCSCAVPEHRAQRNARAQRSYARRPPVRRQPPYPTCPLVSRRPPTAAGRTLMSASRHERRPGRAGTIGVVYFVLVERILPCCGHCLGPSAFAAPRCRFGVVFRPCAASSPRPASLTQLLSHFALGVCACSIMPYRPLQVRSAHDRFFVIKDHEQFRPDRFMQSF